jgi:hypothetical protein
VVVFEVHALSALVTGFWPWPSAVDSYQKQQFQASSDPVVNNGCTGLTQAPCESIHSHHSAPRLEVVRVGGPNLELLV